MDLNKIKKMAKDALNEDHAEYPTFMWQEPSAYEPIDTVNPNQLEDDGAFTRLKAFVKTVSCGKYVNPNGAVDHLIGRLQAIGIVVEHPGPVDLSCDINEYYLQLKRFGGSCEIQHGKNADNEMVYTDGFNLGQEVYLKLTVTLMPEGKWYIGADLVKDDEVEDEEFEDEMLDESKKRAGIDSIVRAVKKFHKVKKQFNKSKFIGFEIEDRHDDSICYVLTLGYDGKASAYPKIDGVSHTNLSVTTTFDPSEPHPGDDGHADPIFGPYGVLSKVEDKVQYEL